MRTKTILDEYRRWIDFAVEDADITEELNRIAGDWEKMHFTAVWSLGLVA